MYKHLLPISLLAASLLALTSAQSGGFAFDVVSIKPASPNERGMSISPDPGNQTYVCQRASLLAIMVVAYGIPARQVEGGPGWLISERWDITAKADHPGTIDQLNAALVGVLEDRFHLKVSRVTKQESVLDLKVAPGGAKLRVHDVSNNTDDTPVALNAVPGQPDAAELSLDNTSMDFFTFSLTRLLHQGVINQTGLGGRYDISVVFPHQPVRLRARGAAPGFLPLIAALPKQLGLELVSAKGPVEYLHIDSVAKPTAN